MIFMEYYLMHHGVKGQKWGVRRYQNKDGTLTESGKKRYGVSHLDEIHLGKPLSANDPSVKDSDIVQRAKYLKDTASKEEKKAVRKVSPGSRKAYYEARAVGLNKDAASYVALVGSKGFAGDITAAAGAVGSLLGGAGAYKLGSTALAAAIMVGGVAISPYLGYTVNAIVDRHRNKTGKMSSTRELLERLSENPVNMIDV